MINYDTICREAVSRFGIKSQVDMAHEEMAELDVALFHLKRGKANTDDVITEIADVAIMTYQLALIFGVDKVHAEIERKLERLEQKMRQ